jgi:NAD(P)H dehydrogenase (quinone)
MKPKILILVYSMYGHVFKMSKAAAEGVKESGGEPVLKQVEDWIPKEKWNDEMKAAKESMKNIPVADPHKDLKDIDGIIVCTPTRHGTMTAQMKNFWDQTGKAWLVGDLMGKPAAFITSSTNQHSGQESTILSSIPIFLHHGCVIVGLPYSVKEQLNIKEISGGSPYGASTVAGVDGSPTKNELAMARKLGGRLSLIAGKLMEEKP